MASKSKKSNKKTSNKNLIHIRLEYNEALKSKKDILTNQAQFLQLAKTIKNYKSLRKQELQLKSQLLTQIKNLKKSLNHLNKTLPKITIPKILEKHEQRLGLMPKPSLEHRKSKNTGPRIKKSLKQAREEAHDNSLEAQLREIQEKLAALE